jgi:hypothetical protein
MVIFTSLRMIYNTAYKVYQNALSWGSALKRPFGEKQPLTPKVRERGTFGWFRDENEQGSVATSREG